MNFTLVIQPGAFEDLARIYLWYQEIQDGLGERLERDFAETLAKVEANPKAYPRVYKQIRQIRMRIFPYYVHYRMDGQGVYVLSVDHTSRRDHTWKRRLP